VILFSFSDAMPMSRVDFSPEDEHEHFRRLAHGLAVGQRAFEALDKYSLESGAPVRGAVTLTTAGRIVPLDPSNSYDGLIASVCKGIVAESTCVLWTCEIGRFRSQAAATAWADQFGTVYDKDLLVNVELYERGPMALLIYETCAGALEPASFVVRVPGASSAPWATRRGLFLAREDAKSMARLWSVELGRKVRVVRQRVDGALLEQALREPAEGC
jgi:hypothetical protein